MQYKYNTNTNIYKMYKGYQVIWNQYYLFKVKYLFQNYFKPDHHRFTVASFRLMIVKTNVGEILTSLLPLSFQE